MIFQVAIDGPVASGKGTVAKLLAQKLGCLCLDTGAIYRGITIDFMDHGIDHTDPVAVHRALGELDLWIECMNGTTGVHLHGVDVTPRLRNNEVSNHVFHIAKIPEVRAKVREIQLRVATDNTLVIEGRDTTSVVFPNARFKFYLTASVEERARRRYADLQKQGDKTTLEELIRQIEARDLSDMTRATSPLVKVKGAIEIDATKLTPEQVVAKMESIILKSIQHNET